MKEFIGGFLAFVLLLSIKPTVFATDFPDTEGHWAVPYIDFLLEKGAIDGIDGYFHPEQNVSLAQYVKIIIAASVGGGDPSPGEHWGTNYMKKALELGVIEKSEFAFDWDAPIDRYLMTKIAYNTCIHILGEKDMENIPSAPFTDVTCAPCYRYVEECYYKGIVSGKSDTIFDGDSHMTRAEACTVITKLLDPSRRAAVAYEALPAGPVGYINIVPKLTVQMMQLEPKPILIDVRLFENHAKRFIPGSVCIPLETLDEDILERFPDKNQTIVIYCQAGSRSKKACEQLVLLGYTEVYNAGGIDLWPYETQTENN